MTASSTQFQVRVTGVFLGSVPSNQCVPKWATVEKINSSEISIIVPVGPQEVHHLQLLQDLNTDSWKEILICCSAASLVFHQVLQQQHPEAFSSQVRIIAAEKLGRAEQLNYAAQQGLGRFLWFIHADTRVPTKSVKSLLRRLGLNSGGLFYFDLIFQTKFRWAMKVNEIGVWWRSHFLGMPFGDQAFCMERDLFWSLGGFATDVAYGEDHLFVWLAKRRGIALIGVGAKISTSARKYEGNGWKAMTAQHLRMTYSQAWPQFLAWFRGQ